MKSTKRKLPATKRDPAVISKIMSSVRSQGTEPEMRLRKAVRSLGRRLRYHPTNVPGRPDLTFSQEKVAVFVDGDFWHGHQWRLRGLPSLAHQFDQSRNRAYWIKKINRNIERDRKITRQLRRLGWHVIRLWESDIKAKPDQCLRRIRRTIESVS
ncbi:MAG: very short patch repair endonuclease [Nitrospirae bacterium]|nr:MAG: very short patch repair endonuclease [Nitrospirota bacterium]